MIGSARRLLPLALVAAPGLCQAHEARQGLTPLASGLLHPLMSPAHAVALLALGLWLGLVPRGRAPWLALVVAVLAGLLAHRAAGDPDTDPALLALAACLGIAVAAARPAPGWPAAALAALTGALVALASGPAGLDGAARWQALAGTGLAAVLLVAWTGSWGSVVKRAWQRIALRVLGSWLAAAALLALALGLAGGRAAG